VAQISSAAIRYAEAAFGLAGSEGRLAEWADDLAAVGVAFGEGGGRAFLEDRKVGADEKLALIDRALVNAQPGVRNLVKLLAQKGRGELVGEVVAKFRELYDESRGVVHARVTTAVELSDSDRDALQARLGQTSGKQVEIETEVDPAILGGIVVRVGDTLVDGSARTRLVALKRQLEGSIS